MTRYSGLLQCSLQYWCTAIFFTLHVGSWPWITAAERDGNLANEVEEVLKSTDVANNSQMQSTLITALEALRAQHLQVSERIEQKVADLEAQRRNGANSTEALNAARKLEDSKSKVLRLLSRSLRTVEDDLEEAQTLKKDSIDYTRTREISKDRVAKIQKMLDTFKRLLDDGVLGYALDSAHHYGSTYQNLQKGVTAYAGSIPSLRQQIKKAQEAHMNEVDNVLDEGENLVFTTQDQRTKAENWQRKYGVGSTSPSFAALQQGLRSLPVAGSGASHTSKVRVHAR